MLSIIQSIRHFRIRHVLQMPLRTGQPTPITRLFCGQPSQTGSPFVPQAAAVHMLDGRGDSNLLIWGPHAHLGIRFTRLVMPLDFGMSRAAKTGIPLSRLIGPRYNQGCPTISINILRMVMMSAPMIMGQSCITRGRHFPLMEPIQSRRLTHQGLQLDSELG